MRLAVSRTPKARGRMNRLVVSIRMRAGMSGVGVPSGRRWPREIEGWLRSPVRMVASHRGKASAMFIDSWVVGVNVYGSKPSRLTNKRKIISDDRIRAHLCPGLFSGVINCLVISWRNHSWRVERRLVIQRPPGAGNSKTGKSRESRISGIPSN